MTRGKNFSDWNIWTRRVIPEELRKNNILFKGINEAWTYKGNMMFTIEIMNFSCEYGPMRHLIIKKISLENYEKQKFWDSEEATYKEKIWIRDNVLQGEIRDMIEIFPKESSLVDLSNLYHLWVLPEEFHFPFSIEYPEERIYQESGYLYDIMFGVKEINTEYGKVVNLSIKSKDGKRIPWKAKQEIKDDMIGKEKTAIELIPKDISEMKEDECFMVSIPDKIQLPFGLYMDRKRRC